MTEQATIEAPPAAAAPAAAPAAVPAPTAPAPAVAPAPAPAAVAPAPVEHRFTLKEDSPLGEAGVLRVVEHAKAAGLSVEHTARTAALVEAELQRQLDSLTEGLDAEKAKWQSEIQADQDFGGPQFQRNEELGRRVLEKFGPELKQVLEDSGLSGHPSLFKMLARVGAAVSDDTLVRSGAEARENRQMSFEDMYRKPAPHHSLNAAP